MSRPSGFSTVAVRWEATHRGQEFAGPATFALGNVSIRGRLEGNLRGQRGEPATFFFNIRAEGDPNLPNCSIRDGGTGQGPTVENVRDTSTTLTTNTFTIQYFSCQGFVEPDPDRTGRSEDTQLTLTKQ
jgi:hypothetical protein